MNFKDARQKALWAVDKIPSQHKKALQCVLNDMCSKTHKTPVNFDWTNLDPEQAESHVYWYDRGFDLRMPVSDTFMGMDTRAQISEPLESAYDIFHWIFEWSWDKFIYRYANERYSDLDVFEAFAYFVDKYTTWEIFDTRDNLPEIIVNADVVTTLTLIPHIVNPHDSNDIDDPTMSFSIHRFSVAYYASVAYAYFYHPEFPDADCFGVSYNEVDLWVNNSRYLRWSFFYGALDVDDVQDYDAPFNLDDLDVCENGDCDFELPTVIKPVTYIDSDDTFMVIDDLSCEPEIFLAFEGELRKFHMSMVASFD